MKLIAAIATAFLSVQGASAAFGYYGGKVLPNVEVTTIFYGSSTPYQKEMNAFYQHVSNSTFLDFMNEFSSPNTTIGRGKLVGSFVETSNLKTRLTDGTDLHNYFINLIKTGKINPNDNSYYAMHFPSTTVITYEWNTSGSPQSCSTCNGCGAWHTVIPLWEKGLTNGPQFLYYGVMPDCQTSLGGMQSVSSHELSEAVTDPAGDLIKYAAWLDPADAWGGEIADKCPSGGGYIIGGDGNKYYVQKLWSEKAKACLLPTAPVGPTTTATGTRSTSTTANVSTATTATNDSTATTATIVSTTTTTKSKATTTKSTTKATALCAGKTDGTFVCSSTASFVYCYNQKAYPTSAGAGPCSAGKTCSKSSFYPTKPC